jgi:hypothetical protein
LKIPTSQEATKGLCSTETLSNILNAIGELTSLGSKIIV